MLHLIATVVEWSFNKRLIGVILHVVCFQYNCIATINYVLQFTCINSSVEEDMLSMQAAPGSIPGQV